MASDILYSHTEGPVIAAKLKHAEGEESFIRMGISFPLDAKYRSTVFNPQEDYCSTEVLSYLSDLSLLIDDKKKFTVKKADLCYGGSVKMVDVEKGKGRESVYKTREPLNDSGLYLADLIKVCDFLGNIHRGPDKGVALLKSSDLYLSATIPYCPLGESFGASIEVLDINIPRQVLGCRVEFVLSEALYDYKKIEDQFDAVAQHVSFGKTLSELEQAHKEFLELTDKSREKKKMQVAVKVKV